MTIPPARAAASQAEGGAFRGVERSIGGRKWIGLSPEEDRLSRAISERSDLPDLVCRVLARQGVGPDTAEAFLEPKIRNLMPDPSSLKDLDQAVSRFVSAIGGGEKIAIFADYDVDGGASAALLIDWMRQLGTTATLYVPDRIREGFGPNVPAMRQLAESHSLIICVDCGSSAVDAIEAAAGADVIVLDHHVSDPVLPPALAVVNPNRQDESSELVYLCAAGVVFMFLVAVNRALRPTRQGLPDLMQMLDLVALATVADVSPMQGLNRAMIRNGLLVMRRRGRPGLRALADIAGINSPPNTRHLGFMFGPRINAGGRIGDPSIGARLLATDDDDEAMELAQALDALNRERQQMVKFASAQARQQVEERELDMPLVWAASEDWHPGIVGIVASHISELANRPAIAIGLDGGIGKGSARSIPGLDIGSAIVRCRDEGLLTRGGGHKMAAGLEVEEDRLDTAMKRIAQLLELQDPALDSPRTVRVDGEIQAEAATLDLIEALESAGPYGAGSPPPSVVLPFQHIVYPQVVGDMHLRFSLQGQSKSRLAAIAFGVMDKELGIFLRERGSQPVHVLGRLEANEYRGRITPQLRVEDAAPA